MSSNIELATKEFSYINIDLLKPSIYQSRIDIDEQELSELKDSIQQNGILQPLLVRKYKDYYEVVAGSRRYHAAKALGLKELPVIEKEMNDEKALVLSILENLQRQDLNPIEEAESFLKLQNEFGIKQEEIAKLLSKDRSTVTNQMRLLNLPKNIQEALRNRKLSMSHARTLLALSTENEQQDLFKKIVNEKMSVRDVEKAVKDKTKVMFKKEEKPNSFVKTLEEDLQRILARKIRINTKDGKKGMIALEFYSPSDLEKIIQILRKQ